MASESSELFSYIESHPKVIEAKAFAREEFLKKGKKPKAVRKQTPGECDNLSIITDYTKASCVLASLRGKIDDTVLTKIQDAIAPSCIKRGQYKLADSGIKASMKFSGCVISNKHLDKLRSALGSLGVTYVEVSREAWGVEFEKCAGQPIVKPESHDSPPESPQHLEVQALATSTSSPQTCGTQSQNDNSASKDPDYGTYILSNEKYIHLDLVVCKTDPFGIRVIGTQNRSVEPNLKNPLSTVDPLNASVIKQIREISPTLSILDKSMISMLKDVKTRNALKALYN
jgi:hypothetical protein